MACRHWVDQADFMPYRHPRPSRSNTSKRITGTSAAFRYAFHDTLTSIAHSEGYDAAKIDRSRVQYVSGENRVE